jgi:hypothetical protein
MKGAKTSRAGTVSSRKGAAPLGHSGGEEALRPGGEDWLMPSGKGLLEFALQAGFIAPGLLGGDDLVDSGHHHQLLEGEPEAAGEPGGRR